MMSYDISLRVDILLRFSKFLSPSLEKGRGEAPWSCQCRWWRPFVSQRQGASKHVQSQRGNIGWVNTLNYIIHITTYSLSPYLNISQPFSCFPPQHAGLGRIHVDAQEVKRILLVGFQRGRCFPAKFTVNIHHKQNHPKISKTTMIIHDPPYVRHCFFLVFVLRSWDALCSIVVFSFDILGCTWHQRLFAKNFFIHGCRRCSVFIFTYLQPLSAIDQLSKLNERRSNRTNSCMRLHAHLSRSIRLDSFRIPRTLKSWWITMPFISQPHQNRYALHPWSPVITRLNASQGENRRIHTHIYIYIQNIYNYIKINEWIIIYIYIYIIWIYKDIWDTNRYNVTSCNINIINVT